MSGFLTLNYEVINIASQFTSFWIKSKYYFHQLFFNNQILLIQFINQNFIFLSFFIHFIKLFIHSVIIKLKSNLSDTYFLFLKDYFDLFKIDLFNHSNFYLTLNRN